MKGILPRSSRMNWYTVRDICNKFGVRDTRGVGRYWMRRVVDDIFHPTAAPLWGVSKVQTYHVSGFRGISKLWYHTPTYDLQFKAFPSQDRSHPCPQRGRVSHLKEPLASLSPPFQRGSYIFVDLN